MKFLVVKWPFLISLFIFAHNVLCQEGTQTRQEIEFKKAFEFNSFSIISINNSLINEIQKSKKNFKLNKHIDSNYFLGEDFNDFVFLDYYFDDANFTLAKSGASYRLRYRFSGRDVYMRYQLFPFIKNFYPHRCEIQFKKDYIQSDSFFTAEETRFEFRNASNPFSLKKDAPKAPWKFNEFREYAKLGKYKSYSMMPFEELSKIQKLDLESFDYKLKLVTNRYRTHLNIVNPWGSGPNPDQAYIISIDHVMAYQQDEFKGQFLELEIEIDRSILEKIVFASKSDDFNTRKYSEEAFEAAKDDLKLIASIMQKILKENVKLKDLHPSSKYARAWSML